ncbi:hypothetical protein [Levilactobacillus enshiensis]|nr:hypothetical protein [Levilactobacillus enshiensis]
MKFQQRLPQNLRETILFMAIISLISVNLIAPVRLRQTPSFIL